MKAHVLSLLVCLFSTNFLAESMAQGSDYIDHRLELEKAQQWANSFKKSYPIVLFDRDVFHYKFLNNNALGEDDRFLRIKIISDYIFEKIGVRLPDTDVNSLETYLWASTSTAIAVPLVAGSLGNEKYKFCGVFAKAPNGNQRLEVERILGMNNEEAYHDHAYHQLSEKESYRNNYLISLYHEVAHCLDPRYFLAASLAYEPDGHSVHLSESFAETLALIKIAQMKSKSQFQVLARRRLIYRSLYSRVVGGYLAQHPEFSFGNPLSLDGGVIYYLPPVIGELALRIRSRKVKVEELSLDDMITVASNVVDSDALTFRGYTAIKKALLESPEASKKFYEDYLIEYPDLFHKAYGELLAYLRLTRIWLESQFSKVASPISSDQVLELPVSELCEAVKSSDQELFIKTLENFRKRLHVESLNFKTVETQSEWLDKLAKKLKCN